MTLTGCDPFSSQHVPVITLEETATLRVVSASALPTQRETPVTGVRLATGLMTPQQAARYTQIHTQTHKDTHKYTRYTQIDKIQTGVQRCMSIQKYTQSYAQVSIMHTHTQYTHTKMQIHTLTSWHLFSHAAAAQQEAPPFSVILPMDSVGAERGSLASHVTSAPLGTKVTQHAWCVAATWRGQMRSSATQH